jgi:formate hydrogenlyase subunit 6/NADH:ubiquinone oxidoreductase subunit I
MGRKLPECRNPDHPGANRNTMVCAEEREDCFVFYCKTCRDVLKVQAIQVKTKAWLRDRSRRDMAAQNRLLEAPPPRMNRIDMDSSLREEMAGRRKFEESKKSHQKQFHIRRPA